MIVLSLSSEEYNTNKPSNQLGGFVIPKTERRNKMLATLILLYALDTGQISTGCYVAAWVLTIIEFLYKGLNAFIKLGKEIDNK